MEPNKVIKTNLNLTEKGFISKFRPKRFHKIDSIRTLGSPPFQDTFEPITRSQLSTQASPRSVIPPPPQFSTLYSNPEPLAPSTMNTNKSRCPSPLKASEGVPPSQSALDPPKNLPTPPPLIQIRDVQGSPLIPIRDAQEPPLIPIRDAQEPPLIQIRDVQGSPLIPIRDAQEPPLIPIRDAHEPPLIPIRDVQEPPLIPIRDVQEIPSIQIRDAQDPPKPLHIPILPLPLQPLTKWTAKPKPKPGSQVQKQDGQVSI
jgi:hypothetical protein